MEGSKNIDEIYLHGVERDNGIVLHNIGVSCGCLLSPEFVGIDQFNVPVGYMTTFPTGNTISYIAKAKDSPYQRIAVSVKDISIENLKRDPTVLKYFIGRRVQWYIWAGAIVRNGGKIGEGVPPYKTRWFSSEELKKILRRSDLELQFEQIRRKINPHLPSRLTSLYLAENSDNGRKTIQQALKNYEEFQVKIIHKSAMVKLDMNWVDEYYDSEDANCIYNYWSGLPLFQCDKAPHWEYLLEGKVELIDKSNLKSIQAEGDRIIKEWKNSKKTFDTP